MSHTKGSIAKGKNSSKSDPPNPWTVLVYMVADDPKGGEVFDQVAHRELDRIIHGALSLDPRRIDVAVQVDFRSEPFVWRRVVGRGSWTRPEASSAEPETLYGFFRWARQECPAQKYFLILWGHSKGPFGFFNDDDAGRYVAQTLTLPELRLALEAAKIDLGRKMDVIAFKDCAIATLEVAFELRDLATYLIASQGAVPAEGWPYQDIFAALAPGRELSECAKDVQKSLAKYYEDPDHRPDLSDVPISLLDTSRVSHVADEMGKFTHSLKELASSTHGKRLVHDAISASAAGDPALLDLRTFCARVRAAKPRAKSPDLGTTKALREAKSAAKSLDSALVGSDGLVTRHTSKESKNRREFSGLSVFCFPRLRARQSRIALVASRSVYDQLALSQQSNWSEIALASMPGETPRTNAARVPHRINDGDANEILPAIVWEQLQRRGIVEQIQLDGIDFARRALLGLTTLGPDKDGKGGNLGVGKDDKGGNLGPGKDDKGGNLGA